MLQVWALLVVVTVVIVLIAEFAPGSAGGVVAVSVNGAEDGHVPGAEQGLVL